MTGKEKIPTYCFTTPTLQPGPQHPSTDCAKNLAQIMSKVNDIAEPSCYFDEFAGLTGSNSW